jgi:hypothetical protein
MEWRNPGFSFIFDLWRSTPVFQPAERFQTSKGVFCDNKVAKPHLFEHLFEHQQRSRISY